MVVVVNASHVRLTHDKWDTKLYHWHTGTRHRKGLHWVDGCWHERSRLRM